MTKVKARNTFHKTSKIVATERMTVELDFMYTRPRVTKNTKTKNKVTAPK